MHNLLAFCDISKEDSSTGTWNRIPGAMTDQRFLKSNQTKTGTFSLGQINQLPHKQRDYLYSTYREGSVVRGVVRTNPSWLVVPTYGRSVRFSIAPQRTTTNTYPRGSEAFRLFGATYQCRHVIVLPTCQGRHWRHRHKRILG